MILLQKAKKLAIEELKKRHDARHYLSAFTIYTKPDYRVGLHLNLLCKKLEAVERGEVKRLMVFMPPRHGKSELISKRFPAWFLGRNSTKQVITASYSAKLADKFGRDVRNLVTSKYYRNIFSDVALSIDSKAKDLWETNHGGVFLTADVGESMTGYGGHLAIIDDPDWTVGVKMQRNVDSGYTLLDVVRLRGLPDEVIKTVKAVASQDGFDVKIVIPQDPLQAGMAQVQYYFKMLAGYKIKAIRETGNKIARADPFASQVNIGNVSLLRANWNRSYLDELSDFLMVHMMIRLMLLLALLKLFHYKENYRKCQIGKEL